MLKEIKCEKFGPNIKDKTIKFHEGLNVVLGSEDAANSIGKSTLLLMVDFCFGGKTYAEQKNFFEYIGHHEVSFTFKFSDEVRYFSRPTDDYFYYYECDSSYSHVTNKKPISELHKFLLTHYLPSGTNSTFRTIVSRFMRIHGKNNYFVDKPLAERPGDSENKGLKVMEELFDISSKTKTYHDQYEKLNKQVKILKSARSFGFIDSTIKNDKQLLEAKNQIATLEKELAEVMNKNQLGEALLNSSFSEEDIDLTTSYRNLQRRLTKLKVESSRLKLMSGESELMNDEDLSKLKSLFPSVESNSIEDINRFQKALINNVNFEISSRAKEIDNEIRMVEDEFAKAKEKLDDAGLPVKLSKSSFENILTKRTILERLKKETDAYEKWKQVNQDKKESLKILNDIEASLMPDIELNLNSQLEFLNNNIYKEKRFAPTFSISDSNHYSYFTPADSGTGTTFKSLVLFDIALLKISNLPTVIHDSLLFKNVWNEPISGIFKEYEAIEKQIFVAIDRTEGFDKEAIDVIEKRKVITLGENANSLFGFSWAKKKADN